MLIDPPDVLTPPAAVSSSGSLVSDRFEQAQIYGESAWNTAWELLQAIRNQDYPVDWEVDDWVPVDEGGLDSITLEKPVFEGVAPITDLTPPEPSFAFSEAEYQSNIRTQLAQKLLDYLVNGGSGLDEDTEQAIYDRATARQEIENTRVYNEALNYFASRGWRLPPGALAGRLAEAAYQIAQLREDINNDILIQQSKLAQENTQFTIDRAMANEKNIMDYISQFHQRLLEAEKYMVEYALTTYKIKTEAYKTQLEAYKTEADVYKAKMDGYSSEVDAVIKMFLGKVEEAKAKSEIQIKEAELIIKEAIAKYGLAEGSTEAAAKVSAQLAASALSMVSASAALGYQESRRDSTNYGVNVSSSGTSSSQVGVYTHIHKST